MSFPMLALTLHGPITAVSSFRDKTFVFSMTCINSTIAFIVRANCYKCIQSLCALRRIGREFFWCLPFSESYILSLILTRGPLQLPITLYYESDARLIKGAYTVTKVFTLMWTPMWPVVVLVRPSSIVRLLQLQSLSDGVGKNLCML